MTLDEINRLRALRAKDDGIAFDLEVLKVADQLLDGAERAERAEKERDTLRDEVRAWRRAEHLRRDEPHNEFRTLAEARAATDAAGIKGVE